MMKRFISSAASVVLLLGLLAPATATAAFTDDLIVTLCEAEADDGVCEIDGVDSFAIVLGYKQYTVHFSQAGTGATCHVFIGDKTLADTLPTDLDALGSQITFTALSSTSTAQSFEGPFYVIWVKCTAGSTTHTVSLHASK